MVAGFGRARLEALDHIDVMPGRHEADVLAVVLVGDRQTEFARKLARLRLAALAEREAQNIELLARGAEQEIALVALFLARAEQAAAAFGQRPRRDVMSGRQNFGAQLACGDQEIVEFDRHVAFDAGHRRLAVDIAFGEAVDHRFLEAALVVEHVMRNADALGDAARVVDVLSGAAGALAVRRRAVVVELQRHADDVIALGLEQRSGHRRVDAARHGDDDAGVLRAAVDIEAVGHGSGHGASYYRWRSRPRNESGSGTAIRVSCAPETGKTCRGRSKRCRAAAAAALITH